MTQRPLEGHPVGTVLSRHDGVAFTLRGIEVLDQLKPLWLNLFDHHASLGNAGITTIDREQSWPRRAQLYQRLFDEPGTFVVLAEANGQAVGYALCHIRIGADDTWDTGDFIGEVETLVVAPQLRGHGHGTALLDAAESELARRGAATIAIAVLTGNERTQRFYEGRGMKPTVTFLMRLGSARPPD